MTPYIKALILCLIIPLAISFWRPLGFWRHHKALFFTFLGIIFVFGIWDIWAVRRRHWAFNPDAVWPFRIFGLPLEEVLFFVVIPFVCIFTWEAAQYIFYKKLKQR